MSSITSSASSGSGLDVQATVDQLIYTERAPERLMQSQKALLDTQATALRSLQTQLGSLEDAVLSLKDYNGALNSVSATSSNPSALTATAAASALASTHTIVISNVATTSSWYSKSITDSNFKFATGSKMTVQVGGGTSTDLTFDGKTLEETASYVNQANLGLTASVITDSAGNRLTLVSNTIGKNGDISIAGDSTEVEWKTSSPGQNAHITVDGVPIESATNKVSGVIQGVTLNLADQGPDTSILLTVGPDKAAATQAISSFVSAYNAVISSLNNQFQYDDSSKSTGVLASDTTALDVQNTLLSNISYSASGAGTVQSLRSIGITMNDDGTLALENSQLNDALGSRFSSIRDFFQSDSATAPGFAQHLDKVLSNLSSVDGPVAADLTGVQASSKSLSDQIDDFEVRITARQQQLTDEYTRINVMLQEFSATQKQISAQLESLNT